MIKRFMDIVLSAALLILLSPVMLLVAIAVLFAMGWPIIFSQWRPGLHGELFKIYKFRSMKNAIDKNGKVIEETDRFTRFGRIIRNVSLDELPELFNVLKGDMSIVGPRPLLPEYLDRYTPEQACRHNVRPGITGLAQISGRHSIPFSKRLERDIYYVDHQSIWFDLKILALTIPTVLGARGVVYQHIDTVDDLGLNSRSVSGTRRKEDISSQESKGERS